MGGGWPNLFIVGAARAGTTSLYRYLDEHPAIYMSPMKEPYFFSDFDARSFPEAYPQVVDDEADYLALFEGSGPEHEWLGEASTTYLWDRRSPERIHRASPEARIVIMLRDPVERAYSHYVYDSGRGLDERSFPAAVREDLSAAESAYGVRARYVHAGFYRDSVERYLDRFPGAVHVVFFEDFARDTPRAVEGVFLFLGLESPAGVEYRAYNSSARQRTALGRAAASVARAALPPAAARSIRSVLARRRKPPMDAEVRELLVELYREDSRRLAALLGRIPPWPGLLDRKV